MTAANCSFNWLEGNSHVKTGKEVMWTLCIISLLDSLRKQSLSAQLYKTSDLLNKRQSKVS